MVRVEAVNNVGSTSSTQIEIKTIAFPLPALKPSKPDAPITKYDGPTDSFKI